jgi:hypothetical protein
MATVKSEPAGSPWAEGALLEARMEEVARERGRAGTRSRTLARLRLGSFLFLIAGIVLAVTSSPWFLLLVSLPGLLGFAAALAAHGPVLKREAALEAEAVLLLERRERAARRRKGRGEPEPMAAWDPLLEARGSSEGEPGEAAPPFFELDPGIIDDLDLAGRPRSLFSFLDATSTWFGAQALLSMLRRPLLSPRDIRFRQEAVRSAAEDGPLREELLIALLPLRRHRFESVVATLSAPPAFARRWGLRLWTHLAGTAAPLLLALAFANVSYGALFAIAMVANVALVGWHSSRSNPVRDRFLVLGRLLQGLSEVERVLRAHRPTAEAWRRSAEVLDRLERPGRRLIRWIGLLELQTLGILFEAWNALVLWELRIIPLVERLVEKHRAHLRRAAAALGEIEALLSLSLPLAEEAGFSMPEPLEETRPALSVEGLGHPLLEPRRLVRNDLRLGPGAPMAIITGSNMSGKSTLLKSVGVNLVLAGMGGPVQASSMRWTPLALYSDINVRDSLDDGKSYFAVEVERVARILGQAGGPQPLLAIFDELFRGTNSAERQAIAMALLAHLHRSGGLYLVATHDLALTALSGELPGAANYHFQEQAEGGSMRFDYRLRPGPAPTRNAIRVLEARGYPRELVREARERLKKIEEEAPSGRPDRDGRAPP